MKGKSLYLLLLFLICSLGAAVGQNKVGIRTITPGSTLTDNGSFAAMYNQVTGNYTLTDTDHYVVYNGATNGTVTLPTAISGNGNFKGRIYYIKNTTTSYSLTISAASGENIDGNTTLTLPAGSMAQLVSTGATSGTTWEVANYSNTATLTNGTSYIGNGSVTLMGGCGGTPTGSALVTASIGSGGTWVVDSTTVANAVAVADVIGIKVPNTATGATQYVTVRLPPSTVVSGRTLYFYVYDDLKNSFSGVYEYYLFLDVPTGQVYYERSAANLTQSRISTGYSCNTCQPNINLNEGSNYMRFYANINTINGTTNRFVPAYVIQAAGKAYAATGCRTNITYGQLSGPQRNSGDKIADALTTSYGAYTLAAANTWVAVTPAEYDNLMNTLSSAGKYGDKDSVMNLNATGAATAYPNAVSTTPGSTQTQELTYGTQIPSSNYVVAFSFGGYGTNNTGAGAKLKLSPGGTTSFADYPSAGVTLPLNGPITNWGRVCYVLKKPTATTNASQASYIGAYTPYNGGTNPAYHGTFNGGAGAGQTSKAISGDAANPSSTTCCGYAPRYQVIATSVQQW